MHTTDTPPAASGPAGRGFATRCLDRAMLWAFRCGSKLLRVVPEKTALACADLAGDALFALGRGAREPLVIEARHLLGRVAPVDAATARRLARRTLRLFCRRQLELVRWQGMSGPDFGRLVDLPGLERLDAALAAGRGAILLTAHYGSFLMGPIALSYRGYPVTQVVGPALHNPRWTVQREIHAYRETVSRRFPLRFLVTGNTLKAVLETLSGNGIVVLAFDGREGHDRVTADFLGHAATFSPTVFRIAARTGAPVFPFFVTARPDSGHVAAIEPAFPVPAGPDGRPDAGEAVARFAALLGEKVLAAPDHFLTTIVSQRRRSRSGLARTDLYPGPEDGR